MNLDDRLREAAATLKHGMDPQRVQQDYELLEADYERRVSSVVGLRRLEDEIAGLELEEAAYNLARQYEQQDRFADAVHWFRKAAQVDYADAAARLAAMLDRLGDREGAACWRVVAADDAFLEGDADPDEASHMMDCASVRGHAERYLNRRLPAVELAAIRRHLLHCQECLTSYAARRITAGGQQRDRGKPAAEPSPLPPTVTDDVTAQGAVTGGGAAVLTTEQHQPETGTGRRMGGAGDSVTSGGSMVLYQGNDTIVTTAYFQSLGGRYPIVDLHGIDRVIAGSLLQPRLFELWAWFQGERICLFRCSDEGEFGQVCRALTRARDHAGPT